jgi:ribosomal protein S18 acetylase RimI-like enzyme
LASKAMTLVATSAVQPIGYAALIEPPSSEAWISDLVVVPRWRRQGVGRALLVAAQRWAAEQGHRRLFLETQSKNYPAIHLALKQGYTFCGYNDHYYSTQDIALFFVKGL